MVKTTLLFVLGTLRLMLFLVLYWLRTPVVFVCKFLSGLTLFCWVFSLLFLRDMPVMVWTFGLLSFLAFSVEWLYDMVLMVLSPTTMFTSL